MIRIIRTVERRRSTSTEPERTMLVRQVGSRSCVECLGTRLCGRTNRPQLHMTLALGLWLAERGALPLPAIRFGIRHLLTQRLREQRAQHLRLALLDRLDTGPIAPVPEMANEQHYEIPAAFFELVLGPHLKYSCVGWPDGVDDLASAEEATLALTCERAGLTDGQEVLELGCGWGSLACFIARQYPNSRIVAVSNSQTQRAFIESRRPPNLRVVTADMNTFTTGHRFDRVVSVEMFEHMRNYRLLMRRIADWLQPNGKLFVHIFCHRRFAYLFERHGAVNWMGRHFFTGGLMPSSDLLLHFQDHLRLQQRWMVNGMHYSRTARAWRHNLERQRDRVLPVLERTYSDQAPQWFHRWQLFFLACEELFGYREGLEWLVAHYRFVKPEVR